MSYEENFRVLWLSPTEYDPIKNGPPYLPAPSKARLSRDQKKDVQSFVKQAAYELSPLGFVDGVCLLAVLQACSMLHQSHHWSTRGPAYYADHLMFDRLYTESQEFIDQLAERIIGSQQALLIDPVEQANQVGIFLKGLKGSYTPDEMVQSSLTGEMLCLEHIEKFLNNLKETDRLTSGLSNLLEGMADKHETFVYLLRQRSQEPGYSYNRV